MPPANICVRSYIEYIVRTEKVLLTLNGFVEREAARAFDISTHQVKIRSDNGGSGSSCNYTSVLPAMQTTNKQTNTKSKKYVNKNEPTKIEVFGIMHKKRKYIYIYTHTNLPKNRQHKDRQINTRTRLTHEHKSQSAWSLCCSLREFWNGAQWKKQATDVSPLGKLFKKKIQRANQNT